MISDTLNGCVDSVRVEILENTISPIFDAGMPL